MGNEVDIEVDRFQINNACICVFSYVDISSNIKYDVYRINWYTSDLKGDIGDMQVKYTSNSLRRSLLSSPFLWSIFNSVRWVANVA